MALFLTANGAAVQGDSQQEMTDGAIECTAFQAAVAASQRQGSGQATGRRTHEPAFEDVQFTYNEITWRYEITGTEHSDTWSVK